MLSRCGCVLLGGADTAGERGRFQMLSILDDAFDMVDARFAEGLRQAAARVAQAFARARHVRLGERGLAPWLDAFSALKQWEAWQVHGAWIRATRPRFAASIQKNFAGGQRPSACVYSRSSPLT